MSTPRITYDGRNIDLIEGKDGLQLTHVEKKSENISASGQIETINIFGKWSLSCDLYFSENNYRDLIAWWSWARQGKPFSFAENSSKVGNASINAASASATTSIHLSTSTSFTVDDYLFIQAEDVDDEFEIIRVNSTSATGIGSSAVLKYSYEVGATIRHCNYFPSLVADMNNFQPNRTGVASTSEDRYYQYTFKFKESS